MADACYVYILSYIVRAELKDTKLRELERRAPVERNLRICEYVYLRKERRVDEHKMLISKAHLFLPAQYCYKNSTHVNSNIL